MHSDDTALQDQHQATFLPGSFCFCSALQGAGPVRPFRWAAAERTRRGASGVNQGSMSGVIHGYPIQRKKFRSQTSDIWADGKAEVGRVREEKPRSEKIREEKE